LRSEKTLGSICPARRRRGRPGSVAMADSA
jgi:hypothetical protein